MIRETTKSLPKFLAAWITGPSFRAVTTIEVYLAHPATLSKPAGVNKVIITTAIVSALAKGNAREIIDGANFVIFSSSF